MRSIKLLLAVVLLLGITACAPSKFKTYRGPEVTRVLVFKEDRKLFLMHHYKVLKDYDIGLGFAPDGHKAFEGDGRTPEGTYYIDRRNPNSAFHLSIGISYPNPVDVEVARAAGRSPGGDIFIHGEARPDKPRDWTWGCIAVSNKEIEWIYAMVRDGTPIDIYP
ncbi:L,D-transpeptidase family protein [Anianabacter salinae]|uniref:L,D-transpeptidase family protein n=1 Tax=Anianabacter salinae TaxID=2851023 RepID=UPI00225DCFC0|nr:L,D-transpeptidase family protein [Anianabacter salinae]MBV0913544.1 L,D-transpeptidase family protein [Anianabacter salinae]